MEPDPEIFDGKEGKKIIKRKEATVAVSKLNIFLFSFMQRTRETQCHYWKGI